MTISGTVSGFTNPLNFSALFLRALCSTIALSVLSLVISTVIYASPPVLTGLQIEPTLLAVAPGTQPVTISVWVLDQDTDVTPSSVKAVVRYKDGTNMKMSLNDDGIGPDIIAGNGQYTGTVEIITEKAARVAVSVKAKDELKTKAMPLGALISVVDLSTAPIVTNVQLSPAILAVQNGIQVVTVTARVTDPNEDLKNVKLERLVKVGKLEKRDTIGTLVDDGTNGDAIPGDGVYTIQTTVETAEARHIPLRLNVKDRAKHKLQLELDLPVREDAEAPALIIQTPTAETAVENALQSISGTVVDTNLASVSCNGQIANILEDAFTCPDLTFVPGTNRVNVTAFDWSGNLTTLTPSYVYADGETFAAVSGIAAKGPIGDALIQAWSFAMGLPPNCPNGIVPEIRTPTQALMCLLGTAMTDANGGYAIPVPPGLTSPVLLEVLGGPNATYQDEATGEAVAFPTGQMLQTVLPTPTEVIENVAVTALTHMAAAKILEDAGTDSPTIDQVNAANTDVAERYGLSDIVGTLPANITQATMGDAADYALVLAGFSEQAQQFATGESDQPVRIDPLELIQVIARDFSDGTLDGNAGDVPLELSTTEGTMITVPADVATTKLGEAIRRFQDGPRNGLGTIIAADLLDTLGTQADSTSNTGGGTFVGGGFGGPSSSADSDGDGFADSTETNTGIFFSISDTGTNPNNPDTDGDGLPDGAERNTGVFVSSTNTGTNPLNPDSDGDGLLDGVETNTGTFLNATNTGSSPLDQDTDSDGHTDDVEANLQANPSDNRSVPVTLQGRAMTSPITSGTVTASCYVATFNNGCPGSGPLATIGDLGTLATTSINATDGSFSLVVTPRYAFQAILLSATGGTYVDPAGTTRALTGTLQAMTFFPGIAIPQTINIGVSALSTLAAHRVIAVSEALGIRPGSADVFNSTVNFQNLYGVNPYLVPIDIAQSAGVSITVEQQQLSVIHAGFMQAALDTAADVDPIAYINAVATDFASDGQLNGLFLDGNPVAIVGAMGLTATLAADAGADKIVAGIGNLTNNAFPGACDAACLDLIATADTQPNTTFTLQDNAVTVVGTEVRGSGASTTPFSTTTTFSPDTITNGVAKLRRTSATFNKDLKIQLVHQGFTTPGVATVNETFTLCVYDASNTSTTKPGCNITTDKRHFAARLTGAIVHNTGVNSAVMVDLTPATIGFSGTQKDGTVLALATQLNALTAGFSTSGPVGTVTFTPNTFLVALAISQANIGMALAESLLAPLNGTQKFKFTLSVGPNMTLAPGISGQGNPQVPDSGIAQTTTCTVTNSTANGCTAVTQLEGVITIRNP